MCGGRPRGWDLVGVEGEGSELTVDGSGVLLWVFVAQGPVLVGVSCSLVL